ncbi:MULTISPECIES: Lrp/AsnC family transcriptional regulator [unclassified Arthrobacter]|uniref:Lrp/AsnC family transcriptional regulator n=1 Tax=unclassified Arthrobacter TaxID=235627 RepID=UPI00254A0A1E|nr:Lrp/AsnC family transcriptional regulator [Arthrobacter sp. fls2-241-R2A-172]
MRPAEIANLVIDKLDLALIDLLRQDARATYTTMAATTGVSTGTARTGVMRILARGIVRIGLSLRPASQERVVRLGLGLRITGPATRLTESSERIPGCTFLASSIGQHDVIATVHGADGNSVRRAADQIRALPEVRNVESWIHLRVLKEEH